MLVKDLGENIKDALTACLESLKKDFPRLQNIPVQLEMPRDKSHGDLATNLALKLSGIMKVGPQEIAERLLVILRPVLAANKLSPLLDKVEVRSPGFINFWFSEQYLYGVLEEIEKKRDRFGDSNVGHKKKVQIEFVSANPTGPLTIAHGRQAAVGDSLANILESTNHRVTREYYINDEGTQIGLLGASIRARYLQELGRKADLPEGGYKGGYVVDMARSIKAKYGVKKESADIKYFTGLGVRTMLKMIKDDLKLFGVEFDVWCSQKSITKKGKLQAALNSLRKKGYIYEKDGASWFKSQGLGDDKDRVIIKSDGSFTYLAPDIAYHDNKFKRGFSQVINIWGPDHHGYIARLKAAVKALGHEEGDVSILLVQLATLYRGKEVIPMSTREGKFITLNEVIKEVGTDAARFFFLMRKTNSHLDFDLELAKKTSFDNPVYYIQYGYARTANILKFAKEKYPGYTSKKTDPRLLKTAEEIALLKQLRKFPYVIMAAAQFLEPYYLVSYLSELAASFHRFYTEHRVVTDDVPLSCARLRLVRCVNIVFSKGLSLPGVSTPTRM